MSYLQRKMFANGGGAEANPYYYVNNQNKLVPLDPTKLFNVLETAPIPEIEALIQNPDVRYSPETQEIFRQIVGKRKAGFSSVSPSTFEFGEALPDYLSFYSGVQDAGGVALDTLGEIAERGKGLFTGFMADQGEPQDTFVSERYPFNRQGQPFVDPSQGRPDPTNVADIIGLAAKGIEARLESLPPIGPSEEGILRRGYTNPELAAILNRAQSGEIQDFEEEIEELVKPDVVDTAVVEDVTEQAPRELPTGTVEIINISPDEYEGSNIALLKQEMEIIGRDEEGNPLPETRLLQDPEIQDLLDEIKPIELKVDVDKTEADSLMDTELKFEGLKPGELKEGTEEIFESIRPGEDPTKPIAPIMPIGEPAPEKDAVTRKLEQPGFFGSDRFLDFIRNVGGELTRTGQFGTGLSLGASKAAEERAARELMAEQEESEFQKALRLEKAKNELEGLSGPSDSMKKELRKVGQELNADYNDIVSATNTLEIVNRVKEIVTNEDTTSVKAFVGELLEKGEALFNVQGEPSRTGKSFADLEPRVRAKVLLNQIKQKNIRDILGESGKTISNLDRQIVEELVGSIALGKTPQETLEALRLTEQSIANNLNSAQNRLRTNFNFATQENGLYLVPSVATILSYIQTGKLPTTEYSGDYSSSSGVEKISLKE